MGDLTEEADIEAFAAELVDRFGKLPVEDRASDQGRRHQGAVPQGRIDRIDAGPKGLVVGFRNNRPPNPQGLVRYLTEQGILAKLRPDQRVYFDRGWPNPPERLKGTAAILKRLADIAAAATAKAA